MPEPAPDVERVAVELVKGSLRLHPHPFGARQVCAPLRPPVQPLTHRYTAPCLHPSRPFKGGAALRGLCHVGGRVGVQACNASGTGWGGVQLTRRLAMHALRRAMHGCGHNRVVHNPSPATTD